MTDLDVQDAEEIYEYLLELQRLEDYMDYKISLDLIDAMRESRYANT